MVLGFPLAGIVPFTLGQESVQVNGLPPFGIMNGLGGGGGGGLLGDSSVAEEEASVAEFSRTPVMDMVLPALVTARHPPVATDQEVVVATTVLTVAAMDLTMATHLLLQRVLVAVMDPRVVVVVVVTDLHLQVVLVMALAGAILVLLVREFSFGTNHRDLDQVISQCH